MLVSSARPRVSLNLEDALNLYLWDWEQMARVFNDLNCSWADLSGMRVKDLLDLYPEARNWVVRKRDHHPKISSSYTENY